MDSFLQTRLDLRDDFEELIYLFRDQENKLQQFQKEINITRKYIPKTNFSLITAKLEELLKIIKKYRNNLLSLQSLNKNIDKLREEKYKCRDILRYIASASGSLITSSDWQSPSYETSLYSNAGRQSGKITGTINDYKRDVHLDELEFEKLFLKEYIDARFKLFLHTYLTNSGQGAFLTILTYLLSEKKIGGRVIAGKSSYFQYKQILSGVFGKNLVLADEKDTKDIIKKIQTIKPSLIFLDSLCNSYDLALPDLKTIFDFIYKRADWKNYIIIDNTCLATEFQPFKYRGRNTNVRLISFESLNKYYQFGQDRVTAGIIVCENKDAGGIFEYRKHAGTNISDSSVYALPLPNRRLLAKRLERHIRNAKEISAEINAVYPGIGSFFKIQIENRYINKFIKILLKIARNHNVNIVAGTSFGLNTTRVYLTSIWSKSGKPFLRVSVGTEDYLEIQKIKEVFAESFGKF